MRFGRIHTRVAVFCVWAFVAANASSPEAAEDSLRIAAIVNDEPISLFDLDQRVRLMLITSGLRDTAESRRRLGPEVLRALIDEKLRQQEAKRLAIRVDKAEIDGVLRRIEEGSNLRPGGLEAMLKQNGITIDTMSKRVEADIAWRKLVNVRFARRARITDEEVDDQLARIRANTGKAENLLAEIFVPIDGPTGEPQARAQVERLLQQLQSGVPFRALAQNFSQSAAASVGGDLGWLSPGQLDPRIESALVNLQPGQITPPVRTESGYYIMMLRERRIAGGEAKAEPRVTLAQVVVPVLANASKSQVAVQIALAESLTKGAKTCEDMERAGRNSGSPLSGGLGTIKMNSLPAELRKEIETIKTNVPTQPFQTKDGIVVMMVCKREDSSALDAQRERVRNQILEERLQLGARQYLRDLRRNAFIDIRL